ncbi:hypothetical protein PMAYCL1PPCAC_08466, partial [Pristionchus mayeri]
DGIVASESMKMNTGIDEDKFAFHTSHTLQIETPINEAKLNCCKNVIEMSNLCRSKQLAIKIRTHTASSPIRSAVCIYS